jgi:hypothetical protein
VCRLGWSRRAVHRLNAVLEVRAQWPINEQIGADDDGDVSAEDDEEDFGSENKVDANGGDGDGGLDAEADAESDNDGETSEDWAQDFGLARGPRGTTALMWAAASGNLQLVATLLERFPHADARLVNGAGRTAADEVRLCVSCEYVSSVPLCVYVSPTNVDLFCEIYFMVLSISCLICA